MRRLVALGYSFFVMKHLVLKLANAFRHPLPMLLPCQSRMFTPIT